MTDPTPEQIKAVARAEGWRIGMSDARRIAVENSNYGHIEGNKRAFKIASDIKYRMGADTKPQTLDTQGEVSQGDGELIERLREKARQVSAAHKMLAEAKSARQTDRNDYPDFAGGGYGWIEPEQTDEWLAADRLSALSSTDQREEERERRGFEKGYCKGAARQGSMPPTVSEVTIQYHEWRQRELAKAASSPPVGDST